MDLTRRQFLGAAAAGTAALVVTACGGGGGDGGNPDMHKEPVTCNTVSTSIAANHTMGHVVMVPAADVAAGAAKQYTLTGNDTHTHTLSVTAANFAALAVGDSVMVLTSTSSNHQHTVTLMCGA